MVDEPRPRRSRVSWERARRIADPCPRTTPTIVDAHRSPNHAVCHRLAGPRSSGKSGPLRGAAELCTAAGDKVSLAIGMTGLTTELLYAGRSREGIAVRVRTDGAARLDRRSQPDPWGWRSWRSATGSTSVSARSCDGRRPSSTWPRHPAKGPASALDHRWPSRWHGAALPGGGWAVRWRQDLDDAVAMARSSTRNPGRVVAWTYGLAIQTERFGPMTPRYTRWEEAERAARRSQHIALLGRVTLGVALLNRDAWQTVSAGGADGSDPRVLGARTPLPRPGRRVVARPGPGHARRPGCRHSGMRQAVDDLHQAERLVYGVWATGVLVEALLERARRATWPKPTGRSTGWADLPDGSFRRYGNHSATAAHTAGPRQRRRCRLSKSAIRYRGMAESLGFEGHPPGPRRCAKHGDSGSRALSEGDPDDRDVTRRRLSPRQVGIESSPRLKG